MRKNKFNFLLLLTSVALFWVAIFLGKSFFETYLVHNGNASQLSLIKFHLLRIFSAILGLSVCLYAILSLKGSPQINSFNKAFRSWFVDRPLAKRYWSLFIVLLLLKSVSLIIANYAYWKDHDGWEYLWVAQGISTGHGFSVNERRRWGFVDFKDYTKYSEDKYFPTAIEEPVYPYLLALSYKLFGDYGKLTIFLHIVVFLFSVIILNSLGQKAFDLETGLLAGCLLIFWPGVNSQVRYLAPAMLGGFFIIAEALLILLCLRKPSIRRGITLGLVLGVSSLTLGATLLFIPLSAFLVFLSIRPINKTVWATSAAIIITPCIVMSPWVIRNYNIFGEFIPTRIGLGFIAHQANPILAGTFYPGVHTCTDTIGPMWKAGSASEAVKLAREGNDRAGEIYRRSYACIEEQAPEGYEKFNEAQRDKVYLEKSKEFIFSHPGVFAKLVIYKFRAYFFGTTWQHTISVILAAIGVALVLFYRRRLEIMALILMILSFSAPYGVTMPWFYRYRYPIEPLILLFTSYAVVIFVKKITVLVGFVDFWPET